MDCLPLVLPALRFFCCIGSRLDRSRCHPGRTGHVGTVVVHPIPSAPAQSAQQLPLHSHKQLFAKDHAADRLPCNCPPFRKVVYRLPVSHIPRRERRHQNRTRARPQPPRIDAQTSTFLFHFGLAHHEERKLGPGHQYLQPRTH